MKSIFKEILKKNNLESHDNRALWKYHLTEGEYFELIENMKEVRPYSAYDSRDFTLCFSEWWSKIYDGGHPSRESVYSSVFGDDVRSYFSVQDFYNIAKKGAIKLGINWIRTGRTEYFRTLLLQGGLPVNHLSNHETVYRRFLEKLIELRPTTIEDIVFEDEILNLLPFCSRRDEVLESSLELVTAILNGDNELLNELQRTNEKISKIIDHAKEFNKRAQARSEHRPKFRAYWILYKNRDDLNIQLEFQFPRKVSAEILGELLLLDNVSQLANEYRLFVNGKFIFQFVKVDRGNYSIFRKKGSIIRWDGIELGQEIRFTSAEGEELEFSLSMVSFPKLSSPTLWKQKNESEWILNQGNNCNTLKGALLFDRSWRLDDADNQEKVIVLGKEFLWKEFENSIEIINDQEKIKFSTNSKILNWHIVENKPDWIIKSNLPIIRNNTKIFVYGKEGEKLKKFNLYWREYGKKNWQEWINYSFPVGCLECKIEVDGIEEVDVFYNLGENSISFFSERPDSAEIINSMVDLRFSLKQMEGIKSIYEGNTINIKVENITHCPSSLDAVIKKPRQYRSLYTQIIPPFKGIRLVDPNGEIVENRSSLLISNLMGYRIISPKSSNFTFVRIYNIQRRGISITRKLKSGIIPLQDYQSIIESLSKLSYSFTDNSDVILEFFDNEQSLGEYFISNFNIRIETTGGKVKLINEFVDDKLNLFAIPLTSNLEELIPYPLLLNDNSFEWDDKISENCDHFVIAGMADSDKVNIKPEYSSFSNNGYLSKVNINKQIESIKNLLLRESLDQETWKVLKKYFELSKNLDIPFSTFLCFHAISTSAELAAKTFTYLTVSFPDDDLIYDSCPKIEDELAFSFHWISHQIWSTAVDWVCQNIPQEFELEIRMNLLEKIRKLVQNSRPFEYFNGIAGFVVSNDVNQLTPFQDDFHPNTKIYDLRQRLGVRVIDELDQDYCPSIPNEFKSILKVSEDNYRVKLLLKSPLAVALSILNKSNTLWESNEAVRKNVQYSQWLDSLWYGEAITYSIKKLKSL
jgi:hypothetical protein